MSNVRAGLIVAAATSAATSNESCMVPVFVPWILPSILDFCQLLIVKMQVACVLNNVFEPAPSCH
jgi:hypothetical protein